VDRNVRDTLSPHSLEYSLRLAVAIRAMAPKWPVRSVEALPTFERKTLSNRVLVIGNSVSPLPPIRFSSPAVADQPHHGQIDPITPLTIAKYVTQLLGSENAVLVEHQAVGHTTIAQYSTCTHDIVLNFLLNSQVGHGWIFAIVSWC